MVRIGAFLHLAILILFFHLSRCQISSSSSFFPPFSFSMLHSSPIYNLAVTNFKTNGWGKRKLRLKVTHQFLEPGSKCRFSLLGYLLLHNKLLHDLVAWNNSCSIIYHYLGVRHSAALGQAILLFYLVFPGIVQWSSAAAGLVWKVQDGFSHVPRTLMGMALARRLTWMAPLALHVVLWPLHVISLSWQPDLPYGY